MFQKFLASILYICLSLSVSAQKIIYVNQAAIGANNGQTWKDARTNLADALASAKQNDTIWIAKGTYKPTDKTDRYKTFAITEGICILGGFDGTETKINQRDAKKNVTILSGNIGQQNVKADNCYNVITLIPNASAKCRVYIDGLTIRDGCANNNISALYFYDRSKHGGGIFMNTVNLDSINVTIKNCTITENYAEIYGGGFAQFRPNTCNVRLNISKTLVEKDTSKADGGFLCTFSNNPNNFDDFVFEDNIYRSNSAGNGACFTFYGVNINYKHTYRNSVFEKNSNAYNYTYGIVLYSHDIINEGNVIMDNNKFNNNLCNGVFFNFSRGNNLNLTVRNNVFNNIKETFLVTNVNFNHKRVNQIIANNSFTNNKSKDIYNGRYPVFFYVDSKDATNITFLNNLFYNNDYAVLGYNSNKANLSFFNNIILNNTDRWFYLGQNYSIEPSDIHVLNNITNLESCDSICVRYKFKNKCEPSNRFATTPRFIDTLNGNYRLHQCSVGINIGNDSIVKALGILTDIEGNPRIADGRVDIGPYERQVNYDAIPSVVAPKCFGDKAKLNFDVKLGTPPYTYKWLNTNTMGTGISDLKGGTYQFTVSDSEGCKDSLKVVIPNAPDAIVIADFDFKNAIGQTPTGSVTITKVIGGTPPYKYAWSNGVKDSLITKLLPGSYTVTITDKNDCTTQLNFGINASTATKDVAEKDILNVAPNPTADVVMFTLKMPYATLRLYDALGHEWLTQLLREGENSLSIGHLPKGVYVYMLLTDNVLRASGRVLCL